jgi:hypothetical protein
MLASGDFSRIVYTINGGTGTYPISWNPNGEKFDGASFSAMHAGITTNRTISGTITPLITQKFFAMTPDGSAYVIGGNNGSIFGSVQVAEFDSTHNYYVSALFDVQQFRAMPNDAIASRDGRYFVVAITCAPFIRVFNASTMAEIPVEIPSSVDEITLPPLVDISYDGKYITYSYLMMSTQRRFVAYKFDDTSQ